jgi:hypothetical protein
MAVCEAIDAVPGEVRRCLSHLSSFFAFFVATPIPRAVSREAPSTVGDLVRKGPSYDGRFPLERGPRPWKISPA